MAKIVILSYLPIEPANGGGRVRIRHLATHLADRHNVTMICPPLEQRPGRPLPFRVHEMGARGFRQLVDPLCYGGTIEIIRREDPDVILAEYVWQGPHAALGRLFGRAPIVLDAFDVATTRFRRSGSRLWPIISAYERGVLRLADDILAVSEIDRQRLVALGAPEPRTQVVPNGVDTSEFRSDPAAGRRIREELGVSDAERLLLFFGQLHYPPNADAIRALATSIMPALGTEYRLVVAGRGLNPQLREQCASPQVQFLGPVDRLPAYINAADAVVAPITSGSGTRLKLLESLACGTPTVATPTAAEGIDPSVCGPALIIADGRLAFTGAVRDACRMERTPPPQPFLGTYDWRAIVERIRWN